MDRRPIPTDEQLSNAREAAPDRGRRGRAGRSRTHLGVLTLLAFVIYMLSSGPVMAAAFWLREATGHDAFYSVMWLYAPILLLLPRPLWDPYLSWWVDLLGTVGPG